jgi:hypothetical protein
MTGTQNGVQQKDAALLLEQVSGIIKKYDDLYRKRGLKYNIFKIVGIGEKEVLICRVIADLLNPGGSHYKGGAYLKIFWDLVSPLIEKKTGQGRCPQLNPEKARVSTEYSTDSGRRIDVVIESGNTEGQVFIPMEVKIHARDQEDQVPDYAAFSRRKNGADRYIPVLYLTLDGGAPEKAEEGDYINLSFAEHILEWLKKCLALPETEDTPPVREIIKQLRETIKSLCGHTEEEAMEKEISDLILLSEETVKAALLIQSLETLDFDQQAYDQFIGPVLEAVKKELPEAEDREEDEWYSIYIPLKKGKYALWINYDWKSIGIFTEGGTSNVSAEAKRLYQKMSEITGMNDGNWKTGRDVWANDMARYPGLENTEKDLYFYNLYKQYRDHAAEVSARIAEMARALEKA